MDELYLSRKTNSRTQARNPGLPLQDCLVKEGRMCRPRSTAVGDSESYLRITFIPLTESRKTPCLGREHVGLIRRKPRFLLVAMKERAPSFRTK